MSRRLNPHIYRLGLLSFFNDLTSEMIIPLLPAYLTLLGAGPFFLGLMEGSANSLIYVTTLFAGAYAEKYGKNKQLTWVGYALCALIRPFLGIPLLTSVFLVRCIDRIGKGIRTAPRDGLITALAPQKDWGRAFGIQRALDHSGSLLGAAIASYYLSKYTVHYPTFFLIASIPAILSILWLPRKIPEVITPQIKGPTKLSWKKLPKNLKPYVLLILFVALTTPSQLFLLTRMQELGAPTYLLPLAWFQITFFSLISAYVGGHLADHFSRRWILAGGWLLFAFVFFGFAVTHDLIVGWILLALYGIQAGIVEPAEKAYPASIADEEGRTSALGWYAFAYGLGLLPASFFFGIIWERWDSKMAFMIYAGLTLISVLIAPLLPDSRKKRLDAVN